MKQLRLYFFINWKIGDKMKAKILESANIDDYEILIRRRGENDYASYCPQINKMILGSEHEQVLKLMKDEVEQHIQNLKK